MTRRRGTRTWLFRALVSCTLIVVLLGCTAAEAHPNRPVGEITMEEAKERIRQFEGTDLPDLEPWPPSDGPMMKFRSGDTIYGVNMDRGMIELAVYGGQETSLEVNVSEDEARLIAAEFARRVHPNFDDLTLTESLLRDRGASKQYRFQWVEVVDGERMPSAVAVDVNPLTGEVQGFVTSYKDVESSAPAELTGNDAREIAVNAFHERYGNEIIISEPELIYGTIEPGGDNFLHWRVGVTETTEPHQISNSATFMIDAYSGEILNVYRSV